MIKEIIDVISLIMNISIGFILGFSFGVFMGISGLSNFFTLLPSWAILFFVFSLSLGFVTLIIYLKEFRRK